MKRWALGFVMLSSPALAEDYCGLTNDQRAALPQALAGTWAARLRGAIMVGTDGKPQALPEDADTREAILAADGAGLALAEDDIFPAVTLAPAVIDDHAEPDFALPGESPLGAAELLAPEAAAARLTCDPKTLPQFVVEVPMEGTDANATLRLFALSSAQMVMVIGGQGGGQSARALFDLAR